MEDKVTIYTRAYNTRDYLEQCIESVLSQTYQNFEYILVDNGCTDGSGRIMERYAEADKRITLVRFEKNTRIDTRKVLEKFSVGSYVTLLDSDDWWDEDYLKCLVEAAEKTGADIVATGTMMHRNQAGQESVRGLERRFIFKDTQFPMGFPLYHALFRTTWGKLFRSELYMTTSVPAEKLAALGSAYGGDTLAAFTYLRKAKQICIDASVLHHYRIHKSSTSYQYDPKRFEADVFLYNDAIDFLSAYGPVSAENRDFLQRVYSNAVADTLDLIHNSTLAPPDKLREYRVIASHPLTQAAYRECKDEDAAQSRRVLLDRAIQAGMLLNGADNADFRTVFQYLLPACGKAVTSQNLPLFLKEQTLLQPLLRDDPDPLAEQLLALISKKQYGGKYDLAGSVQALAVDNPLLCQIRETVFLCEYSQIYLMVWRGECLHALESMTGLLLENQVHGGLETFLNLYVSLAASTGQAPAFIFGKLQLAKFFLRQGRREECRAAADELAEMGLEDEELAALRRELEGQP